jgi:hypothetical protein
LFWLFADILRDLGTTVAAIPAEDFIHRASLQDSAKALYLALQTSSKKATSGTMDATSLKRRAHDIPGKHKHDQGNAVAASEYICGLAEAAVPY